MTQRSRAFANLPAPPLAEAWDGLAAFAVDLANERRAGDARHVEGGKMSQDEADRRLRVATALARQWLAIDAGQMLPEPEHYADQFGATWPEIAAETATIAARARAQASTDPAATDRAALTAALAWHELPAWAGADRSHIHAAHTAACCATWRARAA